MTSQAHGQDDGLRYDEAIVRQFFCDGVNRNRAENAFNHIIEATRATPASAEGTRDDPPIAWEAMDADLNRDATITRDRGVAEIWQKAGMTVRPLYARSVQIHFTRTADATPACSACGDEGHIQTHADGRGTECPNCHNAGPDATPPKPAPDARADLVEIDGAIRKAFSAPASDALREVAHVCKGKVIGWLPFLDAILSLQPGAGEGETFKRADVVRLVIAARHVAFDGDPDKEALRELDAASERFASLVPWTGETPEEK